MLPVAVEQVRPEVTYGLRAAVLRPGLPPAQVRFPGDDAPSALHLAAYELTGDPATDRIVGVVALLPEPLPEALGESLPEALREEPGAEVREPVLRLRGMAVEPGWRDRGVGRALVDRLLDEVGRLGGGLIWCNARSPAARFYERAGFRRVGGTWDDPQFGPHVRMVRQVPGLVTIRGH